MTTPAKPNPRRQKITLPTMPSGPRPSKRTRISPFKKAKLNDRQDRFWREYLICGNATKAAMAAGYSKKTAHAQGYTLLKHPQIIASLEKSRAKTVEKYEVTTDRVIAELAKLGFSNMADYMTVGPNGEPVLDLSEVTRDQASALQEVTVEEFVDGRSDKRQVRRVKFKLAEKRGALELLGKNLGLFAESHKHQHLHSGTVTMRGLLEEIDKESRDKPLIEHDPGEVVPGPNEEAA